MAPQVIVYSTPTCPYCTLVKEYLEEKDVDFRVIDVTVDQEGREEFVRKGYRGVPVTIIGTEEITGFDVPKLEKALAQNQ
ncbi:MAG: glutaredoxin family protein [Firmicutes bacterium]|nr:glutaredoxin family protein [Bacillota bacterium]